MELFRGMVAVCLLALALVLWAGLSLICGSVYGISECVGFFNQAVFGLIEDEDD